MKKTYSIPCTAGMLLLQTTLCTSEDSNVTSFSPTQGGGANPNTGV